MVDNNLNHQDDDLQRNAKSEEDNSTKNSEFDVPPLKPIQRIPSTVTASTVWNPRSSRSRPSSSASRTARCRVSSPGLSADSSWNPSASNARIYCVASSVRSTGRSCAWNPGASVASRSRSRLASSVRSSANTNSSAWNPSASDLLPSLLQRTVSRGRSTINPTTTATQDLPTIVASEEHDDDDNNNTSDSDASDDSDSWSIQSLPAPAPPCDEIYSIPALRFSSLDHLNLDAIAATPHGNCSSFEVSWAAHHFCGQGMGRLQDHYTLGDYIHHGSYGAVWFCTHLQTNTQRAVKYVPKKHGKHSQRQEADILREFGILQHLDHPNVLRCYEWFQDQHYYYLVMEACRGGSLMDELDAHGAMPEMGAATLVHQILLALRYCHAQDIVHCDIKPDNILLPSANKSIAQLKLVDFGLAANLRAHGEDPDVTTDGRITQGRGTLAFMSPQCLNGNYNSKTDLWSLGVLTYLLLSDDLPFLPPAPTVSGSEICRKETLEALTTVIQAGNVSFGSNDHPIWNSISEVAKDFIRQLLTVNETQRPSAEQALQHPWMQLAHDLLRQHQLQTIPHADQYARNVLEFCPTTHLEQATYMLIASQLVLQEEKKDIDKLFRLFDANHDGKLSREEVQLGYAQHFGIRLTDAQVDLVLSRVDVAHTGFIEYSEFVIAALAADRTALLRNSDASSSDGSSDCLNTSRHKLQQAFQLMDTQREGFLSHESLRAFLASALQDNKRRDSEDDDINRKEQGRDSSPTTPPSRLQRQISAADVIKELLEQVDQTGTGGITYHQFLQLMLKTVHVDSLIQSHLPYYEPS